MKLGRRGRGDRLHIPKAQKYPAVGYVRFLYYGLAISEISKSVP